MQLINIMPRKSLQSRIKQRRKLEKPMHDESDRTMDTSSYGDNKRVHFGESSMVSVHPKTTFLVDRQDLWYDKEELNSQFIRDLKHHLNEHVRGGNSTSDKSTTGRGLEFHFAQNQRRKDQAAAYVRAIVEKSEVLRPRRSKYSLPLTKKSLQMTGCEEEIQDYASQLTWMTRDLALGMAAQDEAEARAVYEEEAQGLRQ
jgi:hypothetical protein